MAIVALTKVPPVTLGTAFRRAIHEVDPDLPIYNLWTLPQRLERNYWFYEAVGALFAIFAGIALFLASMGLYAVMAHSVGQRTQEIGVRMAMGASAADVLRLVFVNGMKQVAIGLVIGVIVAFGAMRILKAALVQVSPADPTTFALASMVLIAAGVLGCLIPAIRAVRVDPMFALRHE
jgi:ABC-type antimicrobial peptide transport system permease subunit